MTTNTNNTQNWTVGEIVRLPISKRLLATGNNATYQQIIESRYICIREADNGQRGILVKVLGKASGNYAIIIKGQPFWKDDEDELLYGTIYYSYPVPSAKELKEVLDTVRGNESLLRKFEDARMHLNPDSTFWVNKTKRSMLFLKKLQYLNGGDGQLYSAASDANLHYRVSIVYFDKDGEITW